MSYVVCLFVHSFISSSANDCLERLSLCIYLLCVQCDVKPDAY